MGVAYDGEGFDDLPANLSESPDGTLNDYATVAYDGHGRRPLGSALQWSVERQRFLSRRGHELGRNQGARDRVQLWRAWDQGGYLTIAYGTE